MPPSAQGRENPPPAGVFPPQDVSSPPPRKAQAPPTKGAWAFLQAKRPLPSEVRAKGRSLQTCMFGNSNWRSRPGVGVVSEEGGPSRAASTEPPNGPSAPNFCPQVSIRDGGSYARTGAGSRDHRLQLLAGRRVVPRRKRLGRGASIPGFGAAGRVDPPPGLAGRDCDGLGGAVEGKSLGLVGVGGGRRAGGPRTEARRRRGRPWPACRRR